MIATQKNALPVGTRLEEYEIRAVLGAGGFGVTYLAQDLNLDKPVAIKEYLPAAWAVRDGESVQPKSQDDQPAYRLGLDKFLFEAQTLARFHHPNIVQVYRFFSAHDTAYMVMEYEEGESLAALVKARTTPLPQEVVFRLLFPLLDGLKQVHAANYLHRDIKPGNIFIRRRDASPVLLDFGAARQAMEGSDLTAIVTPGYAPFEQYTTGGGQGPWTDIYALGAVLYMMVARKAPPPSVDRSMALMGGQPDPMIPAAEIARDHYDDWFLAAIDWALAVMDKQRPQEIGAWETRLRGPLGAQIGPRGEVSFVTDAIRFEQLVDASPPTQGSGEVTATLPLPTATQSDSRPPAPPTAPPTRTGRRLLPGVALAGGGVLLAALYFFLNAPAPPSPAPSPPAPPVAAVAPVAPPVVAEAVSPEPPAPPPPPADDPLEPRIAELLALAREDLAALRLTSPEGQNALLRYREVLALVPDHAEAMKGMAEIVQRYLKMAREAADKGQFHKAEGFLDKAAAILPDDKAVAGAREELAAKPRSGEKWVEKETGMLFMPVAAGCFDMGCADGGTVVCREDEKPLHRVCLDGFWMGQFEVTRSQWEKVMGNDPSHFRKDPYQPVESVTWEEARAFAGKLSKLAGKKFRLPTEAEWEYACRSGGKNEEYAGGAPAAAVGWHGGILFSSGNAGGETHMVGIKQPNGLRLHDLTGNVWEWVEDVYDPAAYGRHGEQSPVATGSGPRVVRGGGFADPEESGRCTYRFSRDTGVRDQGQGFRLVRKP